MKGKVATGLVSLLLTSSSLAHASTWIEERTRLDTETILSVGECNYQKIGIGKLIYSIPMTPVAYERVYSRYLMEVQQEGWLGEKNEKIVSTIAPVTRPAFEIEHKKFSSMDECHFWVDSVRKRVLNGEVKLSSNADLTARP